MTPEPVWVPRELVDAAHAEQLGEHGGLPGVRDAGLLESALARPQQRWAYEPDADLASLAAAYLFGIAKNHPFLDGNKRTAVTTAALFLGLNGFRIVAASPDVVAVVQGVAAGEVDEAALAAWLRARSVARG